MNDTNTFPSSKKLDQALLDFCHLAKEGSRVGGSKGSAGSPEASQWSGSAFQDMSGDPLLGLTRDSENRLKVIETERGSIAPRRW